MSISPRLPKLKGYTLTMALLLSSSGFAETATAPSAAPGIWQKHRYSFVFMGFTTTYSCDGLAGKLKQLLLAAGARHDVKSNPSACATYGRPDKFARADLTFYSLSPVDAEHIVDGPRVSGHWLPVTFMRNSPSNLGLGDCELVQQFQNLLLPMFTTRNVDGRNTCVPHQLSGTVINLTFDAFTAAPVKQPK